MKKEDKDAKKCLLEAGYTVEELQGDIKKLQEKIKVYKKWIKILLDDDHSRRCNNARSTSNNRNT